MRYFKNLLFFLLHYNNLLHIHEKYRPGQRAFYGRVDSFSLKTGKIQLHVFDYGLYYMGRFDHFMLHR